MTARYCISCGEPFNLVDPVVVLCPACGGPPEAAPADISPPKARPLPARARTGVNPWQRGDTILDTYEVKQIFTSGGMGLVYRLLHRGWGIDLVMKSPRPEIFSRPGGKENFVREAETWVDLGLHPQIVSCYYVRMIDDIPRVFAEYVEGGSLKDWIEDRRLYEGGKEGALERILDTAIQFAWGLGYAHEKGLVHQDVKPANVLLKPEGAAKDHPIAKVSDFGLAKARSTAGEQAGQAGSGSLMVSSGGYTPAYCSPEQAHGDPVSRKTDLWSWAVSILEMFAGEVTWYRGSAALEALEGYLESGAADRRIPGMPAGLVDLLRQCLQKAPERRPADMQEAAGRLQVIYHQVSSKPYPRQQPKPADLRADSLNNRALSLLDLEREGEAAQALEAALKLDPFHVEAAYNLGILKWRCGEQPDDLDLLKTMEAVAAKAAGQWKPLNLLGLIHLERGDVEAAQDAINRSLQSAPGMVEIQQAQTLAAGARGAYCRHTFIEETGGISSASVSADGKKAVVASFDQAIRYWDLDSGKCQRTLRGHSQPIGVVAITPDGERIVSGSEDRRLRIWSPSQSKHLHILADHSGPISCLALSADGRRIFSGNGSILDRNFRDYALRLWKMEDGSLVKRLEGHRWSVECAVLSPDGHYALTASADKSMMHWDLVNGFSKRLLDHTDEVFSLVLSPDGRRVLSASRDHTLRLWDLALGKSIQVLRGHSDWVRTVCFSPDGKRALSGGRDHQVCYWDLDSGRCLRFLRGHLDEVYSTAISQDGNFALSGGGDRRVRLWNLQNGCCLRTFPAGQDQVAFVAFVLDDDCGFWADTSKLRLWSLSGIGKLHANWSLSIPSVSEQVLDHAARATSLLRQAQQAKAAGDLIACATALRQARALPGFDSDPELVHLWNQVGALFGSRVGLRTARCVNILTGHHGWVNRVAFSPDGKTFFSGADEMIHWDLTTGKSLYTYPDVETDVIAVNPDGSKVLTGGYSGTLQLWDVSSHQPIREYKGHCKSVWGAAFTPDGRYIISANAPVGSHTDKKDVRVWDLQTGECLYVFTDAVSPLRSVQVTPNGQMAITSEDFSFLRFWDLARMEPAGSIKETKGTIWAVKITPRGDQLLSGGAKGAFGDEAPLRLWDLRSRECIRKYQGQNESAFAVDLSPDGRFMAVGSDMVSMVRIWDIEHEGPPQSFESHTKPVHCLSFSPDGRFLVTGSSDETVRVWEMDWDYVFRAPVDWDEAASPYLEFFLTLHTPYGRVGLARQGKPNWGEADFQQFLIELGQRGYGWLRPEGVRRELEKMAAERR